MYRRCVALPPDTSGGRRRFAPVASSTHAGMSPLAELSHGAMIKSRPYPPPAGCSREAMTRPSGFGPNWWACVGSAMGSFGIPSGRPRIPSILFGLGTRVPPQPQNHVRVTPVARAILLSMFLSARRDVGSGWLAGEGRGCERVRNGWDG